MLDFILLNIPSSGSVDYAFIPLLLTAGQAALSISKGVSAAKAAEQAAERAGERASEDARVAAQRLADIEAGNLRFEPKELTMSDKMTEAFDTSMSRAAEDVAQENREMALATAASRGDQGMGILSGIDVFGEQARADAIAGLTGRADAMRTLGSEESRISDTNIANWNQQAALEFGAADQMARAAQLGGRAAEDAKLEADRQKQQAWTQGLGTAAMGVAGLTKAAGGSGIFGKNPDAAKNILDQFNTDLKEGDEVTLPEGKDGRKFQFRDGGDMMMLDGEFSHETNKKAIVDEETGIKEGEMTGQEALVFNDEHVAIIEELTNRGDEETLMKFMRQLLSEPQFQDQA
jgi:hypothetical protein